jgi:excisionase family DNA binding protein
MAQPTSTENHLPDLLTVAEVAAYLGVPVSTIHFWRGRKQGPPAFKVGRRLMFRADDVAHWLDERAASSTVTTATAASPTEEVTAHSRDA